MLELKCCSSLTGLPITGAILVKQGGHDYSGLQIFSGLSAIIGGTILVGATYFLGKQKGTWRV